MKKADDITMLLANLFISVDVNPEQARLKKDSL
jgi:hypothetical protein